MKLSKVIIWTLLILTLASIAFSLYARVSVPWDSIFTKEGTRLSTVDAYYSLNLATLVRDNDFKLPKDIPLFSYPRFTTSAVTELPIFSTLLAFASTTGEYSVVTMLVPVFLYLLVLILVFLYCWYSLGKLPALLSVFYLALTPGEFLSRSSLGSLDYHILEGLELTFILLATLVLYRSTTLTKRLLSSGLLIVALLLYFFTWEGALFSIFILGISFIIYFTISILRSIDIDSIFLYFFGFSMAVVSILLLLLNYRILLPLYVVLAFSIVSLVLPILSSVLVKFSRYSKVAILGILVIGIAVFILGYNFNWPYFKQGINTISSMYAWRTGTATSEESPLLFLGTSFSWEVLWRNFYFVFYLALGGLALLIYRLFKSKTNLLFYIVSLIFFLTTFGLNLSMKRFSYYSAIPLAILAAYFVAWLVDLIIWSVNTSSKKLKSRYKRTLKAAYILLTLLVFVVTILPVILGGVILGLEASRYSGDYISKGWLESLSWVKTNTPEIYFYGKVPSYTIQSWWDYGYYITSLAKRCPVSNPGGEGRGLSGSFFAATTEDKSIISAKETLSTYAIIDSSMVSGKYYSMVNHAVSSILLGKTYSYQTETLDTYQTVVAYPNKLTNQYDPVTVYFPNYYRSTAVRMYNFNCERITSSGALLLTYKEVEGNKLITGTKEFKDYKSAADFSKTLSEPYLIGSLNPFASPVDVDPLTRISLIYSSTNKILIEEKSGFSVPEVKVFSIRLENNA